MNIVKVLLYIIVFCLIIFQQFPSYEAVEYERGNVHTIYENPVEWIKISPFEFVVILAFLSVLFTQKKEDRNTFYKKVKLNLYSITIILLLGAIFGLMNHINLFQILNQMRPIFYPIIIVFITYNSINSVDDAYNLLKFMFMCSIFVGFYGVWLFLNGEGRLTLLGSPIIFYDFATVYLLIFSILWYIFFFIKKFNLIKLIFSMFWFSPILLSLFFSYRRSAYIALAISLSSIFLINLKNQIKLVIYILMFLIITLTLMKLIDEKLFTNMTEEFATIFVDDPSNSSNYFRIIETALVFEQIKTQPLVGEGWGSRYKIYDVPKSGIEFMEDVNNVVHDSYLAIWFKTGLLGIIAFIVILILPLIKIKINLTKFKPDSKEYNILVICLGMLTAIIFDFIVGPQIFHIRTTALVAIFYGLTYKISEL